MLASLLALGYFNVSACEELAARITGISSAFAEAADGASANESSSDSSLENIAAPASPYGEPVEVYLDRGDVVLDAEGVSGFDGAGGRVRSDTHAVIVRQAEGDESCDHSISVGAGNWKVVLESVRFQGSSPFMGFTSDTSVDLELRGDSTAIGAAEDEATICVPKDASLRLAEASTGSLRVETAEGSEGAAIGGSRGEVSGALVFDGGAVEANTRGRGAAIGGGSGGANGPVVINGGAIKASVIDEKAPRCLTTAIGCGMSGNYRGSGPIAIRGGIVEATGCWGSGAIGHGYGGFAKGSSIEISGGDVRVSAGMQGNTLSAESVSISGTAKVHVLPWSYISGINAGELKVSGGSTKVEAGGASSKGIEARKIDISGGSVSVKGRQGEGVPCLVGELNMSGGELLAQAGNDHGVVSFGGVSSAVSGGPVTISGGTVNVYGGYGSAGIGGSWGNTYGADPQGSFDNHHRWRSEGCAGGVLRERYRKRSIEDPS